MPAACILLHNYDLFEKAQLKLSPLTQNRIQQDYLPESYARHLPSYQKCRKTVALTRCGLFPLPLNPEPSLWVTLGMGKNPTQQAKNLLISPIRKIPLNRFKSFTVKKFISSPSNSNFQVIILFNLHL